MSGRGVGCPELVPPAAALVGAMRWRAPTKPRMGAMPLGSRAHSASLRGTMAAVPAPSSGCPGRSGVCRVCEPPPWLGSQCWVICAGHRDREHRRRLTTVRCDGVRGAGVGRFLRGRPGGTARQCAGAGSPGPSRASRDGAERSAVGIPGARRRRSRAESVGVPAGIAVRGRITADHPG
jgi:hypothetical protein